MLRIFKQITLSLSLSLVIGMTSAPLYAFQQNDADTLIVNEEIDPSKPSFTPRYRFGDPFSNTTISSPLFLKDPSTLELDVEIDTSLNYTIYEKIGDLNYRPTSSMSFSEFNRYQDRQILKSYWKNRSAGLDGESAVSGRNIIPPIYISPILDRIFGGTYVELIPRGFVTLDFGLRKNRTFGSGNVQSQNRPPQFNFENQISMNVTGKVGEKLAVTANFDNNNSFDFENNLKVEYTGFEEDIIKKLEIGNVSLPLNNTLISGAQNLFGVKAQMQFGKLYVTSVLSSQRGKAESVVAGGSGGAQGRQFELLASDYDENRHFFLGHFFRDNYEKWLSSIPNVFSGVNVTRVEVYVLNRQNNTQTLRNVVALMDLAEPKKVYREGLKRSTKENDNDANDLYNTVQNIDNKSEAEIISNLENLNYGLIDGTDFSKITGARKLDETSYTINRLLGYISLKQKLNNDEVLAVSYEYTYNGQVYKVGELSEDYASREDDEVIFMKMLRPAGIKIRDDNDKKIPTWDLMMKNIYYLNASQVEQSGFQLNVIYRDDITGLDNPSMQEGSDRPIIEILGLDRLNPAGDQQPDGNFDFVQDVTINSQNGLIIFPYLEPFNTPISRLADGKANEDFLTKKYVYDTLYRTTRAEAKQIGALNKFYIKGRMQSGSSSEIALPAFNIAPGSVKVYAGGTPLVENRQYTVDYTFAKVRITDEGVLNSGKNITVNYETADVFNFQIRTLMGSRFDYKLSDEVNLGSTFLFYNEKALVTRVSTGNEPARNVKYGFDVNIQKESRLLTKAIDLIPLIQTKEPSSISFSAEFAQLIPGTSNKVDGENASYMDDFEGSATPYSLGNPLNWNLAATPQTDDGRFTDSGFGGNELQKGYRRAKLAWYQVDNIFYRDTGKNNPEVPTELLENHYSRGVLEQEIFPFRNRDVGLNNQSLLNLAYFPEERGPYNYSPNLNSDGLFNVDDAKRNWGGITQAVRTEVDFDNANIEYIEFWLMDPFINRTNNQPANVNGLIDDGIRSELQYNENGGTLYFNLGSISEDVIPDGRHGFENGLPTDGGDASVELGPWGRVTTKQYLTPAFDNAGGRENQDVGMDGLRDDQEEVHFSDFINSLPASVQGKIREDVSADNFQHYLQYNKEDNIVERYKNFNGHDGNTPIAENQSFVAIGSQVPENEDVNADNTLSELEAYYEYKMDITHDGLRVGSNYVVDQVTTDVHGQDVKWFLVRIPIRQTEGRTKYGNISNFKSIKYIRTYLTDFDKPVVLRMANFRMVGSQWRKMTQSLLGNGAGESVDTDPHNLTISVVNIEENAQGNDVQPGYTVPPGVVRDRDNTSAIFRNLNEQSLQLCVDDLNDNDGRAVFKELNLDLINYGRLKMFISAHSQEAQDDDLSAFIRLGSDQNNNYYEIEVPLKITDPGTTDPNLVWPSANEIDIAFDELFNLKKERIEVTGSSSALYPLIGGKQVGHHSLRIKGNPVLSQIQYVVIGIRNPKSDNKQPLSGCIWVNELRVTDFDRTSGWAANASLNTKLADIGNLTASTRYTSFGFGNIQSKISERTREETLSYDVGASISLDKFLPEKAGLQVPMFVSYEKTTIRPRFDPANADLTVEETLSQISDSEERSDYRKRVQDNTIRRSLNFSNVKRVKTNPNARNHIYDIENFAFTYAYSETERTNFNIAEYSRRNYKGAIDYIYSPDYDGWTPFEKSKSLNSPYLKLIKDFNVNPLPDNLSVRANVERQFEKTVYQNQNGEQPNFQKFFYFDRNYSLKWSLANSLSLDYTSRAHSVIDEPDGDIDTQEKYDEVVDNVKKLGRLKTFNQDVGVNYRLPLDKFPFTDWMSSDYRYTAGYSWTAGSLINDTEDNLFNDVDTTLNLFFGHIIENNRSQAVTGKFDLVKLYNKVKVLNEINSPPRRTSNRSAPDTTRTLADIPAAKGLLRLLMSVRSINVSYNINEGTMLPGFNKGHFLLGMDSGFVSPGWGFVVGDQDPNIRTRASESGWLVENRNLTTPFSQVRTVDLNIKANIEPFPDLKIQLDATKRKSAMYQEIYRYDSVRELNPVNEFDFISLSPNSTGSYSISFLTIGTAFKKDGKNNDSETFHEFEQNRLIILNRFREKDIRYDTNSQDVLIPAFIAAYTGKDVNGTSLSPFPKIPIPNWRLDYSGLGKIEALKTLFSSVSLTHSYKSIYSVNSFSSSSSYLDDPSRISLDNNIEQYNVAPDNFASKPSENGGLVPVYVIGQVVISEQFSPLVGINIRTNKRATIRAEYKKQRDLALNLSNNQITEQKSGDISFEYGFTKTDMKLPFKSRGRPIVLKNDIQFRLSTSIKDTKTVQRKIEKENETTNGQLTFRLRPSVNYAINKKLNIEVYFERTTNDPKMSSQNKRNTTQGGFKLRFSLAQ